MSPPRRCSNCSDSFLDHSKDRLVFQELSIITEIEAGLSPTQSTIKVETVLSTIYNLNYLNDLKGITGNDSPLLLPSDQNDDDEEEKELGICETCNSVLHNLFKFYNQFNQLRALDSALSKKIKHLNDLILRIPTIVNNSLDKINQTTTTTINNNNNNKTQQYERGEEESDENEDDTNCLGEDVSNLMECELKEDNDADVNLPQSDSDEDYEQEKSRKFSLVRLPTVKVRTLCHEEIQTTTTTVEESNNNTNVQLDIKQELESDEEGDDGDSSPWQDDDDDGSDFEVSKKELDPLAPPKSRLGQPPKHPRRPPKPPKMRIREPEIEPNSVFDMRAPPKLLEGTCPLCQKVYNIGSNLIAHIMTHVEDPSTSSSSEKTIPCPAPDCRRSFSKKYALADHLKQHTPDEQLACPAPNCSKKFVTGRAKRKHFKSHWKEGHYICGKCEVIFESATLLSNHESTVHPQSNSCPACPDKLIETELLLNKHMEEEHPGEKLFVCEICSSSFSRKRNLAAHSRYHLDSLLRCDLCKWRIFTSQKKLDGHRELCVGEEVFSCSICPKQFKQKGHCLLHEKVHRGEAKELTCDFEGCGKVFYRSSHLRTHSMSHTDERPFTCEQCGASFRSGITLRRHFLVHSGEKTLQCSTCGKKFARDAGLKKHLLTHSDVKGYTCMECGKDFKYTESLRLHFLKHHQEAQFVCTICDTRFAYNFMLQKHIATAH